MPRSSRWTERRADGERGSAALEFILVGLLLLVPVIYLTVALGLIQGQSMGVESAARHVARAVAQSADGDGARASADRVLRSVIDEYDLDPAAVDLALSCRPQGAACPQSGATLIVTVRARVALPLVPPVLGLDRIASIPVESSAAQKVSRFWGAG